MWYIKTDVISEGRDNGVRSRDYDASAVDAGTHKLSYAFRMKDDDGEVYYYGHSDEESFAPLDDFGMPNAGCTSIEYWDRNRWEML